MVQCQIDYVVDTQYQATVLSISIKSNAPFFDKVHLTLNAMATTHHIFVDINMDALGITTQSCRALFAFLGYPYTRFIFQRTNVYRISFLTQPKNQKNV